jgi:hypothetical protein
MQLGSVAHGTTPRRVACSRLWLSTALVSAIRSLVPRDVVFECA